MSAVKTQVTPDVSELSPEAPDSDQALSLPADDKHPFPHDISPSVALVPYFAELICSEGISEKVFALRFDALPMTRAGRRGSRDPIKEWLGGTSAKKLVKLGKPREDGKSLSRTAQLYAARNAGSVLFAASSGPGEENATGLIVPKFGKNPEQHVAVSMTLDNLSKLLLLTRIHYTAWLTAAYMRQDSSREQAAPVTSAHSRTERMPQQQASKQTPSKSTFQSPVAMF